MDFYRTDETLKFYVFYKGGFSIMKKKMGMLATIGAALNAGTAMAMSITPTQVDTLPGSLSSKVSTILGMVQWIGFIVGVAKIMYVGVKYLTAGAGQKAEVKSTMVPILVGAILVMLAPQISEWIFAI